LNANHSSLSYALDEQGLGGDRANASGRRLETEIAAHLELNGFELIAISNWDEARLYREQDIKVAIRNAPYRTLYGHRGRIEFLLIIGERQILVESKRQRVAGSVDEKLPYVYYSALRNIPEREFVFVYDGNGWKTEALDWIRTQASSTRGFSVMEADEFVRWIETLSE